MQKLRWAVLMGLLFLVPATTFGQTASAPQVYTSQAAAIDSTSAVLQGQVNPNGYYTTAYFEYGTNYNYSGNYYYSGYSLGNRTPDQAIGGGTASVQVAQVVQNLQPNTTYYYRVVAQSNSCSNYNNYPNVYYYGSSYYSTYNNNYYCNYSGTYGPVYGQVLNFTTNSSGQVNPGPIYGNLPTITLQTPTSIANKSAILHAQVVSNGSPTTVYFEYGTTSALGTQSPSRLLSADQTTVVNFHVGGLKPGTQYYYRVVAQNSQGTARSGVQSVTTTGQAYTGGATAPVAPATTTTPSSTAPSTLPGYNAVLYLNSSVDNQNPKKGDEFTLSFQYRNDGRNSATQAVLHFTLPEQAEFVLADAVPTVNGNDISFNLGTVTPADNKTLNVHLRIKDSANPGDQLTIPSFVSYRTPKNEERSAASNVGLAVASAATSTIASKASSFPWYVWLLILIILLIAISVAYIFYRYGRTKRAMSG